MRAARRGGTSRIADLAMAGSAKLLFPRPRGAALDAVFLNTAGGITGGDSFDMKLGVDAGATLRLTTQAAERIYRARDHEAPGRVVTRAAVAAGARLDWLPQETILFDGAALDRRLSVDLAGDAAFLGCESLVFGRVAMGEAVRALRLTDRIDVARDGVPLLADRLRLSGDAQAAMARAAVGGGAGALATVILAAPDAEARLGAIRAALPATAGASAPAPGLVVARILAPDGFALRAVLVPLLRDLSGADLPRPWSL